jgi:predicted SnoaL-like aldol condensation-catalyzing enzyme
MTNLKEPDSNLVDILDDVMETNESQENTFFDQVLEKFSELSLSEEEMEQVQLFVDAMNDQDLSKLDEIYAQDCQIHTRSGIQTGVTVIKDIFSKWFTAFDDVFIEIIYSEDNNDLITFHWVLTGVHINEIYNYKPSNKEVAVHGITTWKMKEDLVHEHWSNIDYQSLLYQA